MKVALLLKGQRENQLVGARIRLEKEGGSCVMYDSIRARYYENFFENESNAL